MESTMLSWVHQYGYVGIFSLLMFGIVGLPVPDETLLALSGYLVTRGELRLVPTVLAAFGGSACGITVSYTVGRSLGVTFVRKYGRFLHLSEQTLERVGGWFDRYGKTTLSIGYFVPGARHLIALVAGASKLPWKTFATFAYGGALVWAAAFIGLGYAVGDEWSKTLPRLQRPVVIGSAVLAVGVLWFLWRSRRR